MRAKHVPVLVCGLSLVALGCVTGGGWLASAYDPEGAKAVFGFVAQGRCVDGDFGDTGDRGGDEGGAFDGGLFLTFDAAQGQLEYFDQAPVPAADAGDQGAADAGGWIKPGTIVRLHGVVDDLVFELEVDAGGLGDGAATPVIDEGGFNVCDEVIVDDGLPDAGPIVVDDGFDAGDAGGISGSFAGTYTPQPPRRRGQPRAGGRFVVHFVDRGEPGPSNEDAFAIRLFGGEFDGYFNAGSLRHGNIVVHGTEE